MFRLGSTETTTTNPSKARTWSLQFPFRPCHCNPPPSSGHTGSIPSPCSLVPEPLALVSCPLWGNTLSRSTVTRGQCLGQLDPPQSLLVFQKPRVAKSPTHHPSSALSAPALCHRPRHGASARECPRLPAWNSRKVYRPVNKSSFLGTR